MSVSFLNLSLLWFPEIQTPPRAIYWFGERIPTVEIEALFNVTEHHFVAALHQDSPGGLRIMRAGAENMMREYLLIQWEDIKNLRVWAWTFYQLVYILPTQNIDPKRAS